MDISRTATSRYTTKVFDPNKHIDASLMHKLKILLRFSPSSTNSQPWHFIIAESAEAKAKLARATTGPYRGNEAKVLNASHVVVLCVRSELDDEYLQHVLEQEEADGRFKSKEAKEIQERGRGFYVNMHRNELHDSKHWMEKQVYIALGTLLLGAATLGIDATPIEGFNREILDECLGLREQGLNSVVIASLGYRSGDDFNAELPKSRLPDEEIFTFI